MTKFWKRAAILSALLFILASLLWGSFLFSLWTGDKEMKASPYYDATPNAPRQENAPPPTPEEVLKDRQSLEKMIIPVPNIDQKGQ